MRWTRRDGVLHGNVEAVDDLADIRRLLCMTCASAFDSVVLHLDEVSFMDSDGIEALASRHEKITDGGGRLEVRTNRPSLQRLLLAGPLAPAVDTDRDDDPGPSEPHTCPHR